MASVESCVVCKSERSTKPQRVYDTGLKSLMKHSQEKNPSVYSDLVSLNETNSSIYIHKECRTQLKDEYKRKRRRSDEGEVPNKRTRSESAQFDWKKCCLPCAEKVDLKHKDRNPLRQVHILGMKDNFITQANERNDKWGKEVFTRLQGCFDLIAAEAVYHVSCSNKFRYSYDKLPLITRSKEMSFDAFCLWFEHNSEDKPYTIQNLYFEM